ncbi:SAM-dependent methyltransferase [Planobispora takensis]|nr:SAM-dependent methyltransferase [Planobispora takensis]
MYDAFLGGKDNFAVEATRRTLRAW